MEHVKYVVFLGLLFHALLRLTNPGFQVFYHSNNLDINPSNILHTGLCWVILTIGTLYNYHIRQHPLNILTKLIKLYYIASVITWMNRYKLVNMVPIIQQIKLQRANMWLIFFHKPTQYKTENVRWKICIAGEKFVNAQYINCIKDNTKWYWEKSPEQDDIIVPTRKIVHPCSDVITFTKVTK